MTKPPLPIAIRQRARDLRKKATNAEKLLWQLLRNRQFGGAKFRRQHPIPPYVLDFYCHESKLGIELDGGVHGKSEQEKSDAERTRYLNRQGIRVIRFWNNDILKNTESVLEVIWSELSLS